jgi:Ca2+/Na+ antiporter
MDCANYSQARDSLGPLLIDYYHAYHCTFGDNKFFFYTVMIVWVALLMNLLSSTASNYFSPTLGSICEKLKLPYNVAGVTFLALGNAAPDFFALVASFTGEVNVLVGVGALLGGGVFVCTVVVGSIAILCPCKVSKVVFLRDIGFHILATVCTSVVMIVKHLNLAAGLSFVAVYIVYAVLVAFSSGYDDIAIESDGYESIAMTDIDRSISTTGTHGKIGSGDGRGSGIGLQTAFWHKSEAHTQ